MFQLQTRLAKWGKRLSKMVLFFFLIFFIFIYFILFFFFVKKSSKFCIFRTIRFGSNFANMWSKYVSKNVWRDLRLPVSVFVTVARKSINGRFIVNIDFPIGHNVTITDADIGSLNLSMHYLISIWTQCWWNLNKSHASKYTKFWAF